MANEIILYQPNETVKLEVRLENETVWLTQAAMAALFNVAPQNITYHLRNIFKTAELDPASTCKEFLQVQSEGGREVSRFVKSYNLDAIISVGYRVNSPSATRFRIWATSILKEYLLHGGAINRRIDEIESKVREHDKQIATLIQSALPPREGLFFAGQVYDAFEFVRKIITSAKSEIILIDNYVDDSVLTMKYLPQISQMSQIWRSGILSLVCGRFPFLFQSGWKPLLPSRDVARNVSTHARWSRVTGKQNPRNLRNSREKTNRQSSQFVPFFSGSAKSA